jgi:hypothetical protein
MFTRARETSNFPGVWSGYGGCQLCTACKDLEPLGSAVRRGSVGLVGARGRRPIRLKRDPERGRDRGCAEHPGLDKAHYLNGCYAQWFNRRHAFEGHVVERRFFSGLVESDEYLLALARYILLNPVRAGLCQSAGEWRWSSYRATVSALSELPRPSTWLLSQFGRDLDRARERFAAFVRAGEATTIAGQRASANILPRAGVS